MPSQSIANLLASSEDLLGQTVTLKGWVRSRRDSKAGISFVQVSDGSCFSTLQAVVPSDVENYESEVLRLTTGSSVCIEGEVVESRGKGQSIEVKASKVEVLGFVEDPDSYPIQPKQHSYEYRSRVICASTCESDAQPRRLCDKPSPPSGHRSGF